MKDSFTYSEIYHGYFIVVAILFFFYDVEY